MIQLKNPIMLALDVDSDIEAFNILEQIGDQVGAIKIGPRLNLKYGIGLVEKIKVFAPVFLDNKFFDITNTVLSSVRMAFDCGATFVTIHAMNGLDTLIQIKALEEKLNQIRPFKVLCVTILTSWSESNLPQNLKNQSISHHVLSLTNLVIESKLSGLVCSGHELDLIKQKELFKVVPGIRIEEQIKHQQVQDQKRVMTPKKAIEAGASALVIGRSLLNSENRRQTLHQILESLSDEVS